MGDNFHPQDNQIPVMNADEEEEQGTTGVVAMGDGTTNTTTDENRDRDSNSNNNSNHHLHDGGEQMHVDQTEAAVAEPGAAVEGHGHGHGHEHEVQAQVQEDLQHFVDQNDLITTAAAQASAAVAEHLDQIPQAQAQAQLQVQDPSSHVVQVQDTVDTVANAVANATSAAAEGLAIPVTTPSPVAVTAGEQPMPALHQQPIHIPQHIPGVGVNVNSTYPSLSLAALPHTPTTPNKPSTKQERMDAIWMKHYSELQEYKTTNGHVRVPRKSGPLGEWVRTQRRYYKLWRRGESVPLTKERMELLDQLGFVWLPAEEKVGGGFRGGRPRKRKREEEDALAAQNAAVAAAVVAGQAPPGAYYHHHHQMIQEAQGQAVVPVNTPGVVDGVEDPNASMDGVDVDASPGEMVPGTPASVEGMEGAPTSTPIVPNYAPYHHSHHHDPYYYLSMSKRSDIANQIELLTNRQPLPNKVNQGFGQYSGANSTTTAGNYKTEKLKKAHSYYDDVVFVLKRSNEELRDAELALDRAKKKYDEAQALKDKADSLLTTASEGVLEAEMDEGDGEWIHMYKCLVKYKEQNGNILFPRTAASNGNGNGKNASTDGNENDDGVAEGSAEESSAKEPEVAYGTLDIVIPKVEGMEPPQAQPQAGAATNTSVDLDSAVDAAAADNAGTTTTSTEGAEASLPEAPVEMTEVAPQEGADSADAVAAAPATGTTVAEKGSEDVGMQVDKPPQASETAGVEKTAEDAAVGEVQIADDKEGEKKDGSEAMDVDPPAGESAAGAEGSVQDFVRVYEEPPKEGDAGTITVPSTMEESKNAGASTVTVTEAMLHEWVGKMRKFPKKQFKKWRRHALDKLGFVWHQYNATWTDRYRELVEFRNKEGHTVVPTSNNNLGIWVGTQRKQYRLMQQGKPSHMTVERVEMLNDIGFVWHVNTWNERFEELKAFKEATGHFLVPTDYHNKQLRPWITTQRSHYRFMQEGKPSQLTEERIQQLERIGFPWKTREDWQTRYQELLQYINEFGDAGVPRNYTRFPKLYRWVNCQRMEYQKHMEGSTSRLKQDQVALLESVNFE